MRTPDFFIVGAPRCGTTALFGYLEQHPDIRLASLKEPHFFGSDTLYARRPTLDEYLNLFPATASEKRIGEASTSYLLSKNAATEIRAFCPTARIIAMIRDPVETMYSVHSMLLYYCNEDIIDFAEALGAEDDRLKGRRIPANAHIIDYLFYRRSVRFSDQIQRYFDAFGRERVKVVVFDDFRASTQTVYREVLEFLGVDIEFKPSFQVVNHNRAARSLWLQRLVLDRRTMNLRRKIRPRSLDHFVFGNLRRVNTSSKPRAPMDPALRRTLQHELAPEVERLSILLDRDLTMWSKKTL